MGRLSAVKVQLELELELMMNIYCKFEYTAFNTFCSRGDNGKISTHCFMTNKEILVAAILFFFQNEAKNISRQDFVMMKNACGSHLVFQNEAKNIPRQDFVKTNISCKFQKSSYKIFQFEL